MNDCGLDIVCGVTNWAADGALENLADGVSEGFGKVVAWLGTFWIQVDTPPLLASSGGPSDEVEFLTSHLWFWTLCLAILAVMIGGGRMIWEQRGEPARDIVKMLIIFTLVSSGGVLAIQLLITASDALAKWLIDESTDGAGFGSNLTQMITLDPALGALLLIIFGVIAIIVSTLQMVAMVFRSGLLVVLAGLFPTAAAFTNTEMGKQWFTRFVGWTIAFILYKPAAALIYAAAFKLTGTNVFAPDGNGGPKLIAGLSLMVVALVALPALMRFITPMVGAAAGGAGAGAAMGALAGSAASGAISKGANMGSTRSSGGGSGSTSEKSPKTDAEPAGAKQTAATANIAKGASTAGTSASAAGAGAAATGSGAAAVAGGPIAAAALVGVQVAQKGATAVSDAASGSTGSSTGSSGK